MSIHPMPNQKASLLPTPFITDVLWSVISGSSYMAAWQSGKCFWDPSPATYLFMKITWEKASNPFKCPFQYLFLRDSCEQNGLCQDQWTNQVLRRYRWPVFCFSLLHLNPILLLIFVYIRSLGPGFGCLHFCELWFWDSIYTTTLSLASWISKVPLVTGCLWNSHFKIFLSLCPLNYWCVYKN